MGEKQKLNVVVDMAGVTADTHSAKLKLLREVTGLDISRNRFRLRKTVGARFKCLKGGGERILEEQEYTKMTRKLFENKELILNIPPIEGAIEAIQKLASKHRVIFVTNQRDPSVLYYQEWLKANGLGGIPLLSSSKARNRSKAEFTTGADVVIDDKMDNLIYLRGTVPAPIHFRGWAEHSPEEIKEYAALDGIHSADSWGGVVRIVRSIERTEAKNPYPVMSQGALTT